MYSSIQKKRCKCGCHRFPTIGYKGFNIVCFPQELKDAEPGKYKKGAVNDRNRDRTSKLSRLVVSAQKDVLDSQEAKNAHELGIWFADKGRLIAKDPKCMECNAWIPSKFFRHATAHIFPKKDFPSVATHPMNFLILGAHCGCHDKTHKLDTFSKMKIFPEAVRRFRLFKKSITEKHKYLDAFIRYAEGTQ